MRVRVVTLKIARSVRAKRPMSSHAPGPVRCVFLIGHVAKRLAAIFLMDARDRAVFHIDPVVSFDNECGLVFKEAVVHLGGRDAVALGNLHAGVLVECLQPEADDAVLEDVRSGRCSQCRAPALLMSSKGEFPLVAAERPALAFTHPRGVLMGAQIFQAQGDGVVVDGLVMRGPVELLFHAVLRAELHTARAV